MIESNNDVNRNGRVKKMTIAIKKNLTVIILFFTVLFSSTTLQAAESNRTQNDLGFYVGLLGDPFPSLMGINLGYHPTEFLRLTAGYGRSDFLFVLGDADLQSYGAGVKFMLPKWNFSPVVALNYTYFKIDLDSFLGIDLTTSASAGVSVVSAGIGFDWVTGSGFNLGFGVNIGVSGIESTSTPIIPYLNIGWFF